MNVITLSVMGYQPGMIANSARDQLSRGTEFPCPRFFVRNWSRRSRPASVRSISTPRLNLMLSDGIPLLPENRFLIYGFHENRHHPVSSISIRSPRV